MIYPYDSSQNPCYHVEDETEIQHQTYSVEVKNGLINIYQHNESLGEDSMNNVMVYLRTQQRGMDVRLEKCLYPIAIPTAIGATLALYSVLQASKKPWLIPILGGVMLGLATIPLISVLIDAKACIRVEGATHWERNKEHYLKLLFLIIGATLSAFGMWIIGCKT